MKFVCFVFFLILATWHQEKSKPQALEPIRVALTFEGSEADDFENRLRAGMTESRRVIFVSRAVDFDIYVTAGPITAGDKTIGCVSGVAIVAARPKDKPVTVMVVMGPDPTETARRVVQKLDREFFSRK